MAESSPKHITRLLLAWSNADEMALGHELSGGHNDA